MILFRATRTAVKFFVGLLLAVHFGASAAHAQLYLNLIVDPATTAGAGIPLSGGFGVNSTRSGAGTWHLYAIDSISNSFGIDAYNVKLNPGISGAIPTISNRSPNTTWVDFDDEPYPAGFNDLRSPTNANPILGVQGLANPVKIGGLGQAASNFTAKLPPVQQFFGTTSGQWGNYADNMGAANLLKPLFLAEGTYTGGTPTIDFSSSQFTYFTNAALTTSAPAQQVTQFNPCLCGISVSFGQINNVNGNNPGFVDYTFSAFADLPSPGPLTWSDLSFGGYYVSPGNSGPPGSGPAILPTLDPNTHKFHWNTVGSPVGQYRWFVSASAQGYSGSGLLDVYITQVPEPATISLLGLIAVVVTCQGPRRQLAAAGRSR